MDELEKAKLLSVATKLAKAEIEEARSQLIEQINSIQVKNGRDGRSIVDARIFEGDLTLQFSDGSLANLGRVIGDNGSSGTKGDKGDKGDPGETGPPGPRGDTGLTGPAGKDGERGPRGDKGDRGDIGPKGDKGDQGERGEQGPQGISGERGEPGERGEQGPSGIDGTNGRDGRDGAKGETGERGPQGVPGRDGKDGKDGAVGPQGPKGDKGDKGDPGSDADVTKLEKKLEQFTQDIDRRVSKIAFNAATGGGSSGSGEVLLHRLDDVDYNTVKAPSDGQALVWSASLGKWQANTVSGGGGGGGGITNTFTTTVATRSLIPTSDVTYSIGSNTARYKDIWLSNSTIYLGSTRLFVSGTKLIVNDKPLVSNAYLTSTFIANTTARSLINQKISVANAKSYMQVSNTKAYLANTNAYIATKLNTTTFNSALANTNAYIATKVNTTTFNSALANTNSYINTKASWLSLTSTNTAIRSYVDTKVAGIVNSAPGTLDTLNELAAALANDANFSTTITSLIGTKISVANTKAYLANTNSYIATKVDTTTFNAALANTNSYIATKVDASTFNSALANTNAYIATKVNTTTFNTILANTNAYIATKTNSTNPSTSGLLNHTGRVAISQNLLVSGNTTIVGLRANNTFGTPGYVLKTNGNQTYWDSLGDLLQVANAVATYQTKAVERAALANTNARFSAYLQVANADTRFATKAYAASNSYVNTILANTNAYIATKADSTTFSTALANTNAYIATKVNTTTFNAALANTNAYIATKVSTTSFNSIWANTNSRITLVNSNLTGTNTALRTLISDRLQVANAAATYQTKAIERAALANTNSYIATRASWTALTSTNTAIRALISDRLQVANAAATYATKTSPTTSGVLAHTGRATISTNLAVSGNSAITGNETVGGSITATGNMTAAGIVSGSELVSTNASGDEGGEIKLTKPPNGTLDGGVTIDAYQNKIRFFEQGGSARGAYIDLSVCVGGAGTNLLAGGGSSSNAFSGILVGANVISADSTSDRLTLVAGSGMSISANPTTDTITFVSTGSGGATWAALTSTNTALRLLINDRLQVANAAATYQTIATERAALANTNARISLVNTNLTGTNTALRTLISDRLQVANAAATYVVKDRIVTYAAANSITLNSANTDVAKLTYTGAAGGFAINAPSGSPTDAQKILFRLNTTNQMSFVWNAIFRGSTDLPLPSTSSGSSKTDYLAFVYNSDSSKWDLLAKNFGY